MKKDIEYLHDILEIVMDTIDDTDKLGRIELVLAEALIK